jgi:hypothetical protein
MQLKTRYLGKERGRRDRKSVPAGTFKVHSCTHSLVRILLSYAETTSYEGWVFPFEATERRGFGMAAVSPSICVI